MEKIEVKIQDPIISKLREMCDILKIDQDELINLCLIDGYSLYWFLYKKRLFDLSDIPNEELVEQFHERYELLKEIDTIESEFESKYPFGHFSSNYERYRTFLDYTNAFKDLKTIEKQEIKKAKEAPVPASIPVARKVSMDEKIQKKPPQSLEVPVHLLPRRRVPLILFSLLTTFLIFWLIRRYLDPVYMLRYAPQYFISYVCFVILSLLIMGIVYSICLYFFHKYRRGAPYRADLQMYRIFKKEFKELNPKSSYRTKTDRLIAFGDFLEAKKRALPVIQH